MGRKGESRWAEVAEETDAGDDEKGCESMGVIRGHYINP